jgi:hypothetical protein
VEVAHLDLDTDELAEGRSLEMCALPLVWCQLFFSLSSLRAYHPVPLLPVLLYWIFTDKR